MPADGGAPAPLSVGELDGLLAAIGGFEPCPVIAVATSGGPDSLALAILADRWARQRGGMMQALIIDHRLRPTSSAEAAQVAHWLASRGIPHAVLVWEGPKPASRIQAAAREARYRLLADWCRAHGCLHLLTAHHREDQTETYVIRRRARSGPDGLAGMSAVRELRGVRLVRPLLAVPRARLAALLDAEGQPYVTDPSNVDPRFERSRVRLASEASDDVAAAIRGHAADRIERERAVAALLARAASLHPAGLAVLDAAPIAAAGELGDRALDRVVRAVGEGGYPVARERLARLRAALNALPPRARTLGGSRFVPWRGRWLVVRELGRAALTVGVEPGTALWWDGRFEVSAPPDATAARIGYLGRSGVAELHRAGGAMSARLPPIVHAALAGIWDADGLAAVPDLGYWRQGAGRLPELRFSPATVLCGAGFQIVV